ncbi:transcriptional regulator LysR family [Vibrio variabilis]|uniref:Transcriptional regulator LysR family n=1 Tax=Vibrio variabilis TaxID=990271 RepID=A0ABQ0JCR3_9VIBR|nr:transcriptional regulator LysR family [Vibrio variabilis]
MYNGKLLDGFVVFVEVVESGSFTIAAERTQHSTSYISKEVTKLEERLGVRLLQRTTRTLKLTPEGESFYQRARDVVDAAKAAEELVSGSQMEPTGLLKITCCGCWFNHDEVGIYRIRPALSKSDLRYRPE